MLRHLYSEYITGWVWIQFPNLPNIMWQSCSFWGVFFKDNFLTSRNYIYMIACFYANHVLQVYYNALYNIWVLGGKSVITCHLSCPILIPAPSTSPWEGSQSVDISYFGTPHKTSNARSTHKKKLQTPIMKLNKKQVGLGEVYVPCLLNVDDAGNHPLPSESNCKNRMM